MLLVKTYLWKSESNWIGLFAWEDIRKWQKVGVWMDEIDSMIPKQLFEQLPQSTQENIQKYSRNDKSGNIRLNADDTRFINHSSTPNLDHNWYDLIANQYIYKWEELTDDYFDLDPTYPKEKLSNQACTVCIDQYT